MNTFLAFLAIFAVTHAPAPKPPVKKDIGGTVVRRIRIHSADPYLISGILSGNPPAQPETSTTWIQR
jgi:hypothetical protein